MPIGKVKNRQNRRPGGRRWRQSIVPNLEREIGGNEMKEGRPTRRCGVCGNVTYRIIDKHWKGMGRSGSPTRKLVAVTRLL